MLSPLQWYLAASGERGPRIRPGSFRWEKAACPVAETAMPGGGAWVPGDLENHKRAERTDGLSWETRIAHTDAQGSAGLLQDCHFYL